MYNMGATKVAPIFYFITFMEEKRYEKNDCYFDAISSDTVFC